MTKIKLDHEMTCPTCKGKQDALSSIEDIDREPTPEEMVAVCVYCGAINKVTDNWQLESITQEELDFLRKEYPKQWVQLARASFLAKIFPRKQSN